MFYNFVEKFAQAEPGCCRDGNRIPDSQVVEFIYVVAEFGKTVHLVDRQNHRFFRLAEHVGHLGIRVGQSLPYVYNKNNHIRRSDGYLRLLTHLGQDHISRVRLNAARVNQGKRLI